MTTIELQEWCKDNLINTDCKINTIKSSKNFSFYKENKDIFDIIEDKVNINVSLARKVNCLLNNVFENPICYCGKPLKYKSTNQTMFLKYCSPKCASPKTKNIRVKNAKNNIDENGLNSYQRAKIIIDIKRFKKYGKSLCDKDKRLKTWKSKSKEEREKIQEKQRKTKIENHGNPYFTNTLKTIKTWKAKSEKERNQIIEKQKRTKSNKSDEEKRNIYDKMVKTKIEKGYVVHRKDKPDFINYKEVVSIHSNKNYYKYYYYINPKDLKRSKKYHLDHIYSIYEGFKNNIPVWIMCHPCNLRIISAHDNVVKHSKSDISFKKLLECINKFNFY